MLLAACLFTGTLQQQADAPLLVACGLFVYMHFQQQALAANVCFG
jgi:hypothetical protein